MAKKDIREQGIGAIERELAPGIYEHSITAEQADALAAKYPMPATPEPELIGKVPPKKTNGPLPRETFERGLAHFDQLSAERDGLERELKEARLLIATLEQQLEEIKATRATIETRINQCVNERDQAVHEAGELRGVLNSVAAICVRYHHAQQEQD